MGLSSALSFFFGHSNALDEINETISVSLWWDRGDLSPVMGETFEEVFELLDGSVLCEYISWLVNFALREISNLHESGSQ